jgi:hypothetical protein
MLREVHHAPHGTAGDKGTTLFSPDQETCKIPDPCLTISVSCEDDDSWFDVLWMLRSWQLGWEPPVFGPRRAKKSSEETKFASEMIRFGVY